MTDTPILEARGVTLEYKLNRTSLVAPPPILRAVDEVSFYVNAGESIGLVGESGSGKTTLAKMLVAQAEPTKGQILFNGENVWGNGFGMHQFRKSVQMVFQNPRSSFDPRMRVMTSLREPLKALRIPGDHEKRIHEVLEQVGLTSQAARRYPHEFSGGQLQRLAIARALMPNPKVLIADEPVSALDVSIQAQVLNLLKDLVRDLGLSLILIAHDLSVVGYTTSRVYVLASGNVVETGVPADLFILPTAKETQALVGAVLTVSDGLAGKGLT